MPITAAANQTYIKVYLFWTKSHYLPAKYLHNNTDIYISESSFMKGKRVTQINMGKGEGRWKISLYILFFRSLVLQRK
jgi:hypothetical protein